MIVKKQCPYVKPKIHYIDVDTDSVSMLCPVCGRPIIVSQCLQVHKSRSRRAHGISLHIPRGYETGAIRNKIIEYVAKHPGKNIGEIARAVGFSPGKTWYHVHKINGVVVEKRRGSCCVEIKEECDMLHNDSLGVEI